MKFKKLIIFIFLSLFISRSFCIGLKTDISSEVSPVYLGSEWSYPGLFSDVPEASRLLPFILYAKTVALKNIAKKVVERDDFKEIFTRLDESPFKMILRRQYYLYTKGIPVDRVPITFSVQELFDAGILDDVIDNAKKNGKLDLSNFKISSLNGLRDVADKINRLIFALNLSNNEIEVVDSDVFRFYFSRLKRLDLSYNKIFFLQKDCFDNLESLEFLDLGHNKIFYLSPGIFSNLFKLKGLDLSDNQLRRFKKPDLKSLKKINLADNPI